MNLQKQIEKAAQNHDDEIVAVMKEVRNLLRKPFTKLFNSDIIKNKWNENEHPRSEDGRFADSGKSSEKNSEGKEKSSHNSISAKGANKFQKGFSKSNLKNHWIGGNGMHSHKGEYLGMTMEQYAKRALDLVQSPASKNVLGYKTKSGQIVRYDKVTNDFVKGDPKRGIATMFKPKQGELYFKRKMEKEGGIDYD